MRQWLRRLLISWIKPKWILRCGVCDEYLGTITALEDDVIMRTSDEGFFMIKCSRCASHVEPESNMSKWIDTHPDSGWRKL